MKSFILVIWLIVAAGCDTDTLLMYDGVKGQYVPLAEGNIWEYDETTDFQGHDTTTQRIVELDTPYVSDDVNWYHTVDICPFRDILIPNPVWCAGYAVCGNRILVRPDGPGPVYYEPQVLLDLPLLMGKIWTLYDEDTTYINEEGDRFRHRRSSKRYVRIIEPVSVPAGDFPQCILVEDSTLYYLTITYTNGSPFTQVTIHHSFEWYAEGVGLVRQIRTLLNSSSDGDSYKATTTQRLRSYSVRTGE